MADQDWDRDLIRSEIVALDGGKSRDWHEIARLIDEVDSSRFWELEASSFTNWVTKAAARWNRSAASLWRFRGAHRTLTRLLPRLQELGVSTAALRERPGSYNPEALDLLWQLSRFMDGTEFGTLAKRFVALEVSRTTLRRRLNQYKAAAATIRGTSPDSTQHDEQHRFARTLITALDKPRLTWLPDHPMLLALVQRSALTEADPSLLGPDITLVTKTDGDAYARFHYVAYDEERFDQAALADFIERYHDVWLAVAAGRQTFTRPHPQVGVLTINCGSVELAQPASTRMGLASRTGDTAQLLLGQILARRSSRTRII